MTTICTAPPGSVNRSQLTDAFAAICRRAEDYGLRCDLEFIPMYCVSDLNMAWHIVRDAGMKNSGIVFDYWHFMRGNPDFELLGAIPGDRISAVQLSDALMIVPDGRNASDDCMNFRLPCGEGEFPIDSITRTLAGIDALRNVGPEIFSLRFDTLSADGIVAEIGKFFPALLDRARNPARAIAAQQGASNVFSAPKRIGQPHLLPPIGACPPRISDLANSKKPY
jgi:sugar phosphate isomerase/epimerase